MTKGEVTPQSEQATAIGWRAVAERDRELRTQERETQGPSASQLQLLSIREAVESLGWRGARREDERAKETEATWRDFTLSESNITQRDQERREKMERRAEKRAKKAQEARDSWSNRTKAKDSLDKGSPTVRSQSTDRYLSTNRGRPQAQSEKSFKGRQTAVNTAEIDKADIHSIDHEQEQSKAKRSNSNRKKRERPPINGEWLKNAGLRYLARFNASEQHFRTVLFNKIKRAESLESDDPSVHSAWVDAAVLFAREYGGLDDARFAMGLARSLKRRGLARGAARLKMRQKRLEPAQIEIALSEQYDQRSPEELDPNLFAAARAAKKKRLGPWGPSDIDYPTLQKQLAKLARRGFSYGIAQQVLKATLEEAEEWLARGD